MLRMAKSTRTRRQIVEQVMLEFRMLAKDFVINAVLGATWMPRPVRMAGYRAIGIRTRTGNIFSGLSVHGPPRKLSIGAGTFINHDCYIETVADVTIGDDCQLGPQVCIVTSHHPRTASGHASKVPEPRPVHIGSRVWIGARAMLLPGVSVGDDVVIAAGAVVSANCLATGTYAGVPAHLVRGPVARLEAG